MVGVEGIADWIGREVVDRDGEKVGKLADVYFDTADSEPVFIAVKSGAFGRSHSVAPLKGATLARDYVRLDAAKDLIKDAPSEDAGGRLTGVDALAVLKHFGLPGESDLEGEERVCFQTAGAAEETERKRAEVAAEESRAASETAAASSVTQEQPEPDRDYAEEPAPVAAPAEPARVEEPAPVADEPVPVAAEPVPLAAAAPVPAPLPPAPDDDDPLARLAELERRVSALEARL